MSTDYASLGRGYASHIDFYSRNRSVQNARVNPDGFTLRIGGVSGHGMPLTVPADQWDAFKLTFLAGAPAFLNMEIAND